MSKTKLNIIQPSLGLVRLSDSDLLSRTNAVHDGMVDNTAYPSPPLIMRNFKAALDAYTAAVAATLDGGKSATAERDKCRAEVIIMLAPPRALRRGPVQERHGDVSLQWFRAGFDGAPNSTAALSTVRYSDRSGQ